MEDEKIVVETNTEPKSRRAFVKGAAKAAVAAPAAVLLLNASTKPAQAEITFYGPNGPHSTNFPE